jgi:hypothetical protein
MQNVVQLTPHEPEPDPPKPAFSFDMTQPDPRGMVSIDACVPYPMAVAFLKMLIAFKAVA